MNTSWNDVKADSTFVIIPMLNEQDSIAQVLESLPEVQSVIVVDNGSSDNSPEIAQRHGADVILEPQRGYGKACLAGIERVIQRVRDEKLEPQKVVIAFCDADYSDHPNELPLLVHPIQKDEYDFVVGSRSRGNREQGSMPFQARFGNWLACSLMRLFWWHRFTDLGPFRAIRLSTLNQLEMNDENFGWTIEMQIKAVRKKCRILEVPVSYRRRIGVSKISGTLSGTIRAGYKILFTIFKYRLGFG